MRGLAAFFVCSFVCWANAGPVAVSTNVVTQVKTNFEADAVLSPQEVKEVISLAQQCGISRPAEIRTFHYIPGGGRGVAVKSVERVKGSDITFDNIAIGKLGWTDFEAPKKNRLGKFWANPSEKYTTHLRVCDFRGEKIRVNLDTGVTAELCDKVISLIAEGKVRLPSNQSLAFERSEMKEMLRLKPSGLSRQENGRLWLHFTDRLDALQFRIEKGEIIPESVIQIVI